MVNQSELINQLNLQFKIKSTTFKKQSCKSKVRAWSIWSIAATFYFYQFILRVSSGLISNNLMSEFSISSYSLGVIISFYYYGYTFMQIPAGLMLDRFGLRFPLVFASFLCLFGIIVFITSKTIFFLCLGRLLIGIGSAFGFLSCIKAATLEFPSYQIGLIIGLSVMIGYIGGVSVYGPFAELILLIGWRAALIVAGMLSFIIALLSWIVISDIQPSYKNSLQSTDDSTNVKYIFKTIKKFLKTSQIWIFGFYGLLMQMPISSFLELWGVSYLSCAYEINCSSAAKAISFTFLGMIVGGPLLAWITDVMQSYRISMRLGAFFSAVQFFFIIYFQIHINLIYTLFFISGVMLCVQIFSFASICNLYSRKTSGIASGILNMMCMTSGVIFQPLIGFLLDLQWEGTLKEGAPYYSLNNYFLALSIIPIGLMLSCILTFLMREAYPRIKKLQ